MSEKHEPTPDPADPHAADRAAKPDDAADREPVGFDLVLPNAAAGDDDEPPADQVTLFDDSADAQPPTADPDTIALAPAARDADTVSLTSDALTADEAKPADEKPAFIMPPASEGFSIPDEPVMSHGPGDDAAEASAARLARLDEGATDAAVEDEAPSRSSTPTLSGTVPPTVVGGMSTTDWLAARPSDADEGDAADTAPAAEGTGNDADFLIPDPAVAARLSADVPGDERGAIDEPADEPRESFEPTTPTLVGVTAPTMPTVVGEGAVVPPPVPPVTDKPVQMDVEPSPEALASVPVERDDTIPLAAVATGTLIATATSPSTAHDPTDAEVFAHAHDDVEYRAGQSGWGVVTKVAGAIGLAGCTAGLLIMLAACAGLAPASPGALDAVGKHLLYIAGAMVVFAAAHVALAALVQKAWIPGAIVSVAVAAVLGAGAVALWFGRGNVVGFNPLSLGWVVSIAGGAGLVLAVIGGLIEHRRMREETHVLAAVFTNFLAGVGGLLLYAVAQGWNFLESGVKAAQ